MVDSSSKRRKKTITESDTATLLQRYDVTTILRMLQEMAYYAEIKMDWSELVKKTTTGITNAREYQLLWRHLAYRDPLLPVEDDAQPLDDDSDVECELEASPAVSFETSMEAIAHVKVLAASYVPSDSDIPDDSVEAPLTINIPYRLPEGTQEPSESPWLSRGMNITFPVCLQKATPTEGLNGTGSASSSMALRRKRKKWSPEEDEELFAAVKRCGEGNWAHIVKGDFRGERTASQLSQRWALIRRRCDTTTSVSQSGQQQTEAQIAVNHALSLAVGNRPPSKKHAVGVSPVTSSCGITETQAKGGSSSQCQQQSQPVVQSLPRVATSLPASKSRVSVKRTTASSTSRSDLMVTANSVAAAACMGGVSTTASGSKAELRKTAAPLVPKTEPVKVASTACTPRPLGSQSMPKVEPGKSVFASTIIKAVGPANTRPITIGNQKLVAASSSSNKPPIIASRSEGSTMLSASASLASVSRIVSNQRVSAPSVPDTVLPPKPTAETITCKPGGVQKEQARGNGASSLVLVQPNKMTSTCSENLRGTQAQTSNLLPNKNPVVQTAVGGAPNQNLIDKPSDKTAVPSIGGTDSQSKAKCEVNNKVGSVIKVSNVCGKPPEVATVAGTGQGV